MYFERRKMFWFQAVGNLLMGILDMAVGIFVVFFIGSLYGHDVGWAGYFLGAALGVSPDIDLVYLLIRRGGFSENHHEYLTHRPIIGIPAAVLIGGLLGGWFWAFIAGICVCCHYVHDTKGFGGGGIAWFWPFSRFYYSPFGIGDPEQTKKVRNHHKAIERLMLSPSRKVIVENAIVAILIMIVGGNLWGWQIGFLLAGAFWVGIFTIWFLYSRYAVKSL